ncbi:MAG: NADP-dependent isocitrate dehydrogenase [Alphaproteobacteria bacterium]|nr:NADP-dependent isocitrate dehydrogenase [Alphaproteobacteria bacterium]
MTDTKTPITIAYGDGIGPEIMEATLAILEDAGAQIQPEVIEIGEKVYTRGIKNGIEESSWESLMRTKCFLKAPITTPQGGGFKSLNVTIRKAMAMFANVRPCVSYAPFVRAPQTTMNMVIIRENEEDLYAGIEHQQTDNVVQCLKLISQTGSERIIRYAFEYARANNRKKVTCISKDNIMKMTDGLFHKTFRRIAEEYPNIENSHMIVDIGAAKIAARPDMFDVVVTENLYGDILSDIAAEVAGSVGLCGSANIGKHGAMFEAIHGSAPDITGQGIANPSGLLHGALMMLQHIGQNTVAETIHNAWLKTLEDGIHTGDIYSDEHSTARVNTKDFTKAVIERLGARPEKLTAVDYAASGAKPAAIPDVSFPVRGDKKLVGIDVFVHGDDNMTPDALAGRLTSLQLAQLKLSSIDSRGLLVWPEATALQEHSDHWRCRFVSANEDDSVTHDNLIDLLMQVRKAGFDFIKTENLYSFNGEKAFTVAQGQ